MSRQIGNYLAGLSRQIGNYLAGLSRQIAFPFNIWDISKAYLKKHWAYLQDIPLSNAPLRFIFGIFLPDLWDILDILHAYHI